MAPSSRSKIQAAKAMKAKVKAKTVTKKSKNMKPQKISSKPTKKMAVKKSQLKKTTTYQPKDAKDCQSSEESNQSDSTKEEGPAAKAEDDCKDFKSRTKQT